MRLHRGVLTMICLLLPLTGCGTGEGKLAEQAAAFRECYGQPYTLQAQAQVTADYGERAYQYTIQCQGNAEAGSLTVLEPEEIAGAGAVWTDGTVCMDYEELTLEIGTLSPDGLSPADALPVILKACTDGALLESGWADGEERELYLLLQNPDAQESTIALWAQPETGALTRAEIRWEEQTVIQFDFTDFALETAESAAG